MSDLLESLLNGRGTREQILSELARRRPQGGLDNQKFFQCVLLVAEHGIVDPLMAATLLGWLEDLLSKFGTQKDFLLAFLTILYISGNDRRLSQICRKLRPNLTTHEDLIRFRQYIQYSNGLESESNGQVIYMQHPNVCSDIPFSGDVKGIFNLSMDSHYFKSKFIVLQSCLLVLSDLSEYGVVISLFDPDEECTALVNAFRSETNSKVFFCNSEDTLDQVSLESKGKPIREFQRRALYASARFLVIGSLLRSFGVPVITIDADLCFTAKPNDYLDNLLAASNGSDVGIRPSSGRRLPGFDYWVHCSVVNPTTNGIRFAERLAAHIIKNFQDGLGIWTIDQIAFNTAMHSLNNEGIELRLFDPNLEWQPNTPFLFHLGGHFEKIYEK